MYNLSTLSPFYYVFSGVIRLECFGKAFRASAARRRTEFMQSVPMTRTDCGTTAVTMTIIELFIQSGASSSIWGYFNIHLVAFARSNDALIKQRTNQRPGVNFQLNSGAELRLPPTITNIYTDTVCYEFRPPTDDKHCCSNRVVPEWVHFLGEVSVPVASGIPQAALTRVNMCSLAEAYGEALKKHKA